MCVHPPFWSCSDLEAGPHDRAVLLRSLRRGYEPPGCPEAPGTCALPCRSRGGGPGRRAPMEVPDLRAAAPNFRDPTPPVKIPCHLGLAGFRRPRPVSGDDTLHPACQRPRHCGTDRRWRYIHMSGNELAIRCQGASRPCESSGVARCHPPRVTAPGLRSDAINCGAARFPLSPRG